MITDEKRILYKLFHLKISYSKVWNTKTLVYYAEQLSRDRQLPKAYQDIEDDPHQMGGNFILKFTKNQQIFNKENNNDPSLFEIVYSYRSINPPDRPSVSDLIKLLETI